MIRHHIVLKSITPHRLESLCYQYFSWLTDGPQAHEELLQKPNTFNWPLITDH